MKLRDPITQQQDLFLLHRRGVAVDVSVVRDRYVWGR